MKTLMGLCNCVALVAKSSVELAYYLAGRQAFWHKQHTGLQTKLGNNKGLGFLQHIYANSFCCVYCIRLLDEGHPIFWVELNVKVTELGS